MKLAEKLQLMRKREGLSQEDLAEKLEKTVINPETKTLNPNIVGQSPYTIAKMSGFEVPKDTKILVAEIAGVGADYPLSKEKLFSFVKLINSFLETVNGLSFFELGGKT